MAIAVPAHGSPIDAAASPSSRPEPAAVAAKLTPPVTQPRGVIRTRLLARLAGARDVPVVMVVAPPGYGKTTVLGQWATADPHRFSWLTLDRHDNDPPILLTRLALALERVVPVDRAVFPTLAAPRHSAAGVLSRLLPALDRLTESAVLVLDDAQTLEHVECRDVLTAVVERLPPGLQLAVGSREEPWLPVPRWRAEGRTLEYGTADLAMDDDEADRLLRSVDVVLSPDDVASLNRGTEGWPVALYLTALAMASGPRDGPRTPRPPGSDRFVVDYVHSELLSTLPAWTVEFLTRTSVLEQLSGPLCDAVLDAEGSADTLAWLERRNLLVMPLDHERRWYRYHHVFGDLLYTELERREPGHVQTLRRRAADWYEANGRPQLAVEQAMALGDVDRVIRIVTGHAQPFFQHGRIATVRRWFEWIDAHTELSRHPAVAVLGAWVHTMTGHAAAAERWADAANSARPGPKSTSDPERELQGRLVLLRATMCRSGLDRARKDATVARTALREADDVLRRRPRLGVLGAEVTELRNRLDSLHATMAGASSLTAAELRLLSLLSTHLSFREIGMRLHISPNTVKTEAISIYRKLGVSSRGDAVGRAQTLGLLVP